MVVIVSCRRAIGGCAIMEEVIYESRIYRWVEEKLCIRSKPGGRRLPSRILLFEEQNNMSRSPIGSKRTVVLAGAILLCGSMGLAQMGQQPSSPAGQNPGQNNPAMNSQMNGM